MCSQFYCCKLFTSKMLNHGTEVTDGTGMKPTVPMLPESSPSPRFSVRPLSNRSGLEPHFGNLKWLLLHGVCWVDIRCRNKGMEVAEGTHTKENK